MSVSALLQTQLATASLFLSTPTTRTPTILLLIASFGSSLHHPVTTFFYLAVLNGAASDAAVSIGTLGFIQGLGGTVGGPLVGWALDRYGPFVPIVVTAAACSMGCLWRGMADSLWQLQMGAVLNGVGVNLWSVVMGHLVKSFDHKLRSEVLSGIAVQLAVVQIAGKALFPIAEYALRNIVGVTDDLLRYRLHMGVCTAFCFYGTVALCWDRDNLRARWSDAHLVKDGTINMRSVKYKQKQSDILDNDLEEGAAARNCRAELQDHVCLPLVPSHHSTNRTHQSTSVEMMEIPSNCHASHKATKNIHNNADYDQSNRQPDQIHKQQSQPFIDTIESTNNCQINPSPMKPTQPDKYQNEHVMTTIIFTVALLVQSLSNTILTVLWPLIVHDRFHLSAQTFGVLTFISSLASMGAMASFPVVERKVGRVRCAAGGFGVAALLGVVFCISTFGGVVENSEVSHRMYDRLEGSKRNLVSPESRSFDVTSIEEDVSAFLLPWRNRNMALPKTGQHTFARNNVHDNLHSFFADYSVAREDYNATSNISSGNRHRIDKIVDNDQSTQQPYLWHALSAIALHSSLSFIEPSIKSIFSIVTASPSDSLAQESAPKLGFTMGFMTTIANIGGMIGNIAGTWMYKLSNDNESVLYGNIFVRGGSLAFFVSALLLGASSLCIWGLDEPIHSRVIQGPSVGSPFNEANCCDVEDRSEISDDSESLRDGCCLSLRERETNHVLKCE
ncbi:hypothetical protein HJC23_002559 [Cyclotella cryptica]|uniref:Major facilitator superfamily (MFS) profile domain-containing protein n=1 Tax=Cyclotella cryptica TaxID=29204 RepID=A0ABD3QW04_9STRA|eukprot:CCRYP_001423-RA/>CCRYP_001423-RA protein AED:0.01 eAED:-0.00 QI:0/-1/0/1/-1/1/1/0/730